MTTPEKRLGESGPLDPGMDVGVSELKPACEDKDYRQGRPEQVREHIAVRSTTSDHCRSRHSRLEVAIRATLRPIREPRLRCIEQGRTAEALPLPMTLLLFKLFTTPTLILFATLVSRRWGEATGGWLVGLPLTSGPIAVFLAIEHGAAFSQLAAAGSIEGTAAQACFAVVYARLAARRSWPICLLAATVAFLVSGLTLSWLQLSAPILVAIAIGCLVIGLASLGRSATTAPVADPPEWDLPVRMIVATLLVLLVTAAAHVIGPDLSGLAATFPLFAMVLAVFAHRHQGGVAAQNVMRGLLLGLFGFIGFFAAVSAVVTRLDLVSAFSVALVVNLLIQGASLLALQGRPR